MCSKPPTRMSMLISDGFVNYKHLSGKSDELATSIRASPAARVLAKKIQFVHGANIGEMGAGT